MIYIQYIGKYAIEEWKLQYFYDHILLRYIFNIYFFVFELNPHLKLNILF